MQTEKRLLIVTPFFASGGTEKMVLDLSVGLQKLGWKVYVTSSGGRLQKSLRENNIEHFLIPELKYKAINKLFVASLKLRKIIADHSIDTINSHAFSSAMAVKLCSLFFFNANLNHFFTLHIPEKIWYFRVIAQIANITNLPIITVCNSNVNQLIKSGLKSNQVKVIYNGVDADFFTPSAKAETNIFKIGIVARLVERKGHLTLLHAIDCVIKSRKITKIKLFIYGDGPQSSKLQEEVQTLNLQKFVYFKGDTSDVRKAYRNMNLFILPSFSEGFPITILEAMSCGIPIIASNVNGIPEVLEQEKNGFLCQPGDSKGLAQLILAVLDNVKLQEYFKVENRKKIKRNFTTDKMVQEYNNLLTTQKF